MFSLNQLKEQIFHLQFDNRYDLGMHFVRYQEFYESPVFNGTDFTLVEYMDWYARNRGDGVFTYPSDWGGHNVPSSSFREVWDRGVPDWNKYDTFMKTVYESCEKACNDQEFYIIGTVSGDGSTLNHEMAHGLYYTNMEYKLAMDSIVANLKDEHKKAIADALTGMDYAFKVLVDETQAYCSTGLCSEIQKALKKIKAPYTKICKPFQEVFKEYHDG